MNTADFNAKKINRLCILLVFCMLISGFYSLEAKAAVCSGSVDSDLHRIISDYGSDMNTRLCTTKMLRVRSVTYVTTNSKRNHNEVGLRESTISLCAQIFLHNMSDMFYRLRWEVFQEMYTDIFILDFIHRQDGEK